MKLLLENWRGYLNEDEGYNKDVESMISFLKDNPNQKINIDSPKGSEKGFGNKTKIPLPFDYGEYSEIINPADKMGWDLIIAPSYNEKSDNLQPAGYVRYKEGTGKEGNDKIIISKNGTINEKDKQIITDYFKILNSVDDRFEDTRWL